MATRKQEGRTRPLGEDDAPSRPKMPRAQPTPEPARKYWNSVDWFGPLFSRHFTAQEEGVRGVNSAMSQASKQWSDAHQLGASRQHEQSMQKDLLNAGIQMKQMELQKDRERAGLLRGLISSAGGGSGFTIDQHGNYSRH